MLVIGYIDVSKAARAKIIRQRIHCETVYQRLGGAWICNSYARWMYAQQLGVGSEYANVYSLFLRTGGQKKDCRKGRLPDPAIRNGLFGFLLNRIPDDSVFDVQIGYYGYYQRT